MNFENAPNMQGVKRPGPIVREMARTKLSHGTNRIHRFLERECERAIRAFCNAVGWEETEQEPEVEEIVEQFFDQDLDSGEMVFRE